MNQNGVSGAAGWIVILFAIFMLIALLSIGEPDSSSINGQEIVSSDNLTQIYTTTNLTRTKEYKTIEVSNIFESSELLKDDSSSRVSSGSISNLFSSESVRKSFTVSASKLREIINGKLEFSVKEATGSGLLEIMINNDTIFSKNVPDGKILVNFGTENLSNYNIFTVKTRSSGLNFLEETKYIIENLTLTSEKYAQTPKTSTFFLSAPDYSTFTSGQVQFYVRNGNEQDLIVRVNDEIVYSGKPTEGGIYYSDEFDNINEGINNIKFETEKEGVYTIDDVLLKYHTGKKITKTIDFTLGTITNTTRLKVNFELVNESKEGVILVKLSNDVAQKTESVRPEKGDNSVTFGNEYLSLGSNSIIFSSTGKYTIRKITISRLN